MSDPGALRQLTVTRVRVMLREPEIIFWVFAFPIFLAMGLGLAFSDPTPERIPVAVEAGTLDEEMLERMSALDPDLQLQTLSPDEAADALRRGEVALVLARLDGEVTFRFDPSRSEGRTARAATDRALQEAAGGTRPVTIRSQEVEQSGQRYIDWLIPGIIGFNLMSTGLWGVGFYVTQSRQSLQLKRLVATPMPRGYFLLAQILARFFFLLVEVPLLVFFAWLVFGVEMAGDALSLAVVVLLGAACFSGLGLLACSRARTTEGVSGIINVIIMPMVVLSGVFFSPARFPEAVQPLIQVLPLTALNDALRAVYNDGLPITAAAGELGLLSLWTAAAFFLALRLFRWQ